VDAVPVRPQFVSSLVGGARRRALPKSTPENFQTTFEYKAIVFAMRAVFFLELTRFLIFELREEIHTLSLFFRL
jgi:hypothetical protein